MGFVQEAVLFTVCSNHEQSRDLIGGIRSLLQSEHIVYLNPSQPWGGGFHHPNTEKMEKGSNRFTPATFLGPKNLHQK